jgi:S-adenosyl-L-methionine hydrolase (adenosine-forming)
MLKMTVISLTTDFGLADGFVGIMKGVILAIAPGVCFVDLTHEVAPQDVRQAAYVLERATPYFPAQTIHLAVVDPGVGSDRRPLLVTTERAAYVGPDNGIFSAALAEPGAHAWELDQPRFWLPQVSRTFHGRDIFAPVAAHLANGVPPKQLGRPIGDPVRLAVVGPRRHSAGSLSGEIVSVDRFGNLISNIPAAWVASGRWRCRIGSRDAPLLSTYADASSGGLMGLIDSDGAVEIALRNGNAAQQLGVGIGTLIELWTTE